jgi:purine-binding chemotaxis protein CheW
MNTNTITTVQGFDDDEDWDDGAASRTFLIFELATERYAIPIQSVNAILRVPEIALIPDTPPYIRGAVNLRGGVVPVIDLRARFGLSRGDAASRQVLILVEDGGESAALLVDTVRDAVEIHEEHIDSSARFDSSNQFVRGLAHRSDNAMEIVLNISALLGVSHQTAS